MTNWTLEKSQSKNGDPPSINIFKLKLCFPVSNLTYVAYWLSYVSRTAGIKKMSIDVFPALLSTLKRICYVIRSDVINYLRTSPRNVQVILEMVRYNPTSNFACWKVFMSK